MSLMVFLPENAKQTANQTRETRGEAALFKRRLDNEGRRSCLSTNAWVIFTLSPHNGEVGNILASICVPMAVHVFVKALCLCRAAFRQSRVSTGKENIISVSGFLLPKMIVNVLNMAVWAASSRFYTHADETRNLSRDEDKDTRVLLGMSMVKVIHI